MDIDRIKEQHDNQLIDEAGTMVDESNVLTLKQFNLDCGDIALPTDPEKMANLFSNILIAIRWRACMSHDDTYFEDRAKYFMAIGKAVVDQAEAFMKEHNYTMPENIYDISAEDIK